MGSSKAIKCIPIHEAALELGKYNAIAVLELPDIEEFGQAMCDYCCSYRHMLGADSIELKQFCAECPLIKLLKGDYNGTN